LLVLELLRVFQSKENPVHGMEKLRPLALLLLRAGLGAIFIYHGYPKLLGHSHEFIFDVSSRGGLPGYVERLAGLLEFLGGAMLMIGFLTRFLGLLLTIEMALTLWISHQLFTDPLAVGRYELPLACAAGVFALATFGAGSISLDAVLVRRGRKIPRKAKD
jgi:putative oxidoreductase